jgi:MoaA/NifB/PqqE/SkfB family radical SAM enzyme
VAKGCCTLVTDALNFIRKLTIRKVTNIFLAKTSFYVSRIYRRPVVWGLPYAYSIEPTGICNLKCPECPTGRGLITRKISAINPEIYASVLDQISGTASYLMLYLQGEPYINPNIFEMIGYASNLKIYTCISTNGHYLDKENAERTVVSGLDRLIISLDGTTNETYVQYRKGGSLQVVLTGIRNLVEARKKLRARHPYLILQFIVFRHNQHQINEFKMLAKSLGADAISIKTAQLYDFEGGNERMTDLTSFSRYRRKGEKFIVKRKLRNRCNRLWSIGVITSDGIMAPCCYDKNADHQVGDLKQANLKNIWKGADFMQFRSKVLTNRKGIDICSNCDE